MGISKLSESSTSKDTGELFRYRPDIDGLRGIAVLVVILFHLNPNLLPSGFLGVDVFFVISGYVVTASIIQHQSKGFCDYLLGFYARRVKRLVPALLICVIGTVLLTSLFIAPSKTNTIYASGVAASFGLSNLYFIWASKDYFGLDQELNPFTHTWSLGVEQQFYLVFPILLFFIYGIRRPIQSNKLGVYILLASLVASAVVSLFLSRTIHTWAYYSIISRYWEMAAGALLCSALAGGLWFSIFQKSWYFIFLQIIAGSLLLLGLLINPTSTSFPIPGALPVVFGSVLLIACGTIRKTSRLNQLMAVAPLVYIGKISYSLYLWHWPVFTFFRWTTGLDTPPKYFLALFLAVSLSLASYYFIEEPVRKHFSKSVWQNISVGLSTISITVIAILLLENNLGNMFLGQQFPEKTHLPSNTPHIVNTQITSNNCFAPAFSKYSRDQIDYQKCIKPATNPNARRTFLFGDSHAMHLIPMMDKVTAQTGGELTVAWKASCIISDSLILQRESVPYKDCQDFGINELDRATQRLRKGDIVIISSNLHGLIGRINTKGIENKKVIMLNGKPLSYLEREKEFVLSYQRIIQKLSSYGIHTVLVIDTPQLSEHPEICYAWEKLPLFRAIDRCIPKKEITMAMKEHLVRLLTLSANSSPYVHIFDPYLVLVDEGIVRLTDNSGKLLYSDTNHITKYASHSLTPYFLDFLQKNNIF